MAKLVNSFYFLFFFPIVGGSLANSLSREGSTSRCYACGQSVGLGPQLAAAQGEAHSVSLNRSISPPVSDFFFFLRLLSRYDVTHPVARESLFDLSFNIFREGKRIGIQWNLRSHQRNHNNQILRRRLLPSSNTLLQWTLLKANPRHVHFFLLL